VTSRRYDVTYDVSVTTRCADVWATTTSATDVWATHRLQIQGLLTMAMAKRGSVGRHSTLVVLCKFAGGDISVFHPVFEVTRSPVTFLNHEHN